MKSRFFCGLLALTLALAMGACGGEGSAAPPESTAPAQSAAPPPAPQTEAAETEEGVLWVAATGGAVGRDVWRAVCEAFTEAVPGVRVELTYDRAVEDTLWPVLEEGRAPDVMCVSRGRGAGLTEAMLAAGGVTDISGLLTTAIPGEGATVGDKLLPGFTGGPLTNPEGEALRFAPLFFTPEGLYYNSGLFRTRGWSAPATMGNFWALDDAAAALDIYLLCYPTAPRLEGLLSALAHTAGGVEFAQAVARKDPGLWDSEAGAWLLDTVARLAAGTEPSVPGNANAQGYLKNSRLLLDNRALFLPGGPTLPGELASVGRAAGFAWGFAPLPAREEGGACYAAATCEQAWIPVGAASPELGLQFLAFLYSETAVSLFAAEGAVQPVTGAVGRLSADVQPMYAVYDKGAVAALGGFAPGGPDNATQTQDVWYDGINLMAAGVISADEWKAAVRATSPAEG